MYKKTTRCLVIPTILVAYISTVIFSNRAFAQPGIACGQNQLNGQEITRGINAHGQVLGARDTSMEGVSRGRDRSKGSRR
jgi:hypothetical protein